MVQKVKGRATRLNAAVNVGLWKKVFVEKVDPFNNWTQSHYKAALSFCSYKYYLLFIFKC